MTMFEFIFPLVMILLALIGYGVLGLAGRRLDKQIEAERLRHATPAE